MSEYNEGDLVEAVKGESLIRDRLVHQGPSLALSTVGGTTHYYEILGYTITVIEKAIPKAVLPTEPGLYVSEGMFEYATDAPLLYWLNRELQWSVLWHSAPAENRTTRQMIDGTSGVPLIQIGLVGK